MNVLVVGCGKVGSRLANTLCDEGIDVSVIARTAAEADKMLEPDFKGSLLCGVPIDHSFLNYKAELTEYGYEVAKISMKAQKVIFNKLSC